MIYRSHRGGVYYTPENTMPAFKDALEKGFPQIETDPCYTKDGVIILLHDQTLNRTCRNKDGSKIEKTLYRKDLTYDEILEYDAGIFMGEQFKGVKIPRLEDLLALAEGTDTVIVLDKRIPTDNMDPLFDLVEKYKTKVSFLCEDFYRVDTVLKRFPNARIDYDGVPSGEDFEKVLKCVKPENLNVWLYMDKPNFSWLDARRKASKEKCEAVKKVARLGIANICNPYDLWEAYSFEPDIIEV